MRTAIKNLSAGQLADWLRQRGHPPFRLGQIWDWLFRKWAADFAEMSNLPKDLRNDLGAAFSAFSLDEEECLAADDGTAKFLHRLADGESIESVLIPAGKRRTVCISTQVGCPVQCSFCASGRGGLVRDLSRAEIIDQVLHACRKDDAPVTHVVVMGIGEPLLNLGELLPALDMVCSPECLGLGARHVTVSTSGIPEGIRALAEHGRPWTLALSLHATTDQQRATLIPATHRAPIDEILEACRDYRGKTNRMVTLEYALLAGRNDSDSDCTRLATIARDLRAKVNLIPCNPASGVHSPPDMAVVARFRDNLLSQGARATVRQRRGETIQAACGQLRSRAGM
jgi:23S rRNA (adenine2503-C2)-methyltransferase